MRLDADDREFMCSGHAACPGCGAVIALRIFTKAMGENTILVIPASCTGVIVGVYPQSVMRIPVVHAPMPAGASVASGLRAALDMRHDTDTTVVAWAGDGGTFDIGFQALSGAVERNEDFIYVCYDNEAYMNTGIQRSSSTPYGAWTTTTPGQDWKRLRKKNIVEALVAHRIPYVATANIAFPEDLVRKVKKAKSIKGFEVFAHLRELSPRMAHPLRDISKNGPDGRPGKYLSAIRGGRRRPLHHQLQGQATSCAGLFRGSGTLQSSDCRRLRSDPKNG